MMKGLFFLVCLLSFLAKGNARELEDEIIKIKNIPQEGILLEDGWKYKVGDNPDWAHPDFDDSTWQSINPAQDIYDVPPLWNDSVVWFRIHLDIDPQWLGKLAFNLMQSGASEIYLNGQLIKNIGRISNIPQEIVALNPLERTLSFPVTKPGIQVLAFRYRLEPDIFYTSMWENPNYGIYMRINSFENANSYYNDTRISNDKSTSFRASAYVVLAILFLAFYVSDKKRRTSLYFFVYAAIWAFVWSFFISASEVKFYIYWASFGLVLQIIGFIFLLTVIYELLGQKKQWGYYLIMLFGAACIPIGIFIYPWGWLGFVMGFATIAYFEIARIAFLGFRKKKRGAAILFVGAVFCLISWTLFLLLNFGQITLPFKLNPWFVFSLHHLSMPVAVSIFIGYDFAKTNQTLEQR